MTENNHSRELSSSFPVSCGTQNGDGFARHEGDTGEAVTYRASVSLDNEFNMHMLSPSDVWGVQLWLISIAFCGAASCTVFQKNSLKTFLNELQCVVRRG